MWHWGGTPVWGRSWCWAAGDTESSKRRNPINAIAPGASTAPLGNQLCLPGLSSNIDLQPGIFLSIFLHSLRRYTAPEQGEDKKMYKCSCELLSGPYCWYWLPPETSSCAIDTWFVLVGRKKTCSVSHGVSTYLLASVQLLWCYRWEQCYRSTFSETIDILSICGYSDEVVKYDGRCILSKAACCGTCVLCSPCPRWSQAVIVVSCDFRRMMVLQFGFTGLSVMGDSRPSLNIL